MIFQDCMKTEAVFKSALPYSCLSSLLTYFLTPKGSGMGRPILTAFVGMSMYLFGKLTYTPVCYQKAFGALQPLSNLNEKRKQLQNTDDIDTSYQDQEKYSIHFDNVTDEKSVWDNIDTQSESNTNEFYDATDNFQDELKSESQEKQKKRVTYDDLWIQHRKELKNQFDNIEKNKVTQTKSKSLESQQNKHPKESAIPEEEFDEKKTWS